LHLVVMYEPARDHAEHLVGAFAGAVTSLPRGEI